MSLSFRSTTILAGAASVLLALSLLAAIAPSRSEARNLIAPANACKNVSGQGPKTKATQSMLCFTNYARSKKGLKRFRSVGTLNFASKKKAADILRCDQFSHEACGREFTYWMKRSGYRGCSLGENIAFGTGRLGSSKRIFIAWMNSRGHRSAILSRDFRDIGIGLRTGRMDGMGGAQVWVQNFGRPC